MDPTTLEGYDDWGPKGACHNHPALDWFSEFPSERHQARRICLNDCPVRTECLDWALAHEVYGVWGGTYENEREKIRRKRHIFVEAPQRLFFMVSPDYQVQEPTWQPVHFMAYIQISRRLQ